MREIRLIAADLPDFGLPPSCPELPSSLYGARLAALRERMAAAGLDAIAIYADREHSANIRYLTGFDPRFEEALLILGGSGVPMILCGPENFGAAEIAPVELTHHLYPPFGLLGQDRSRTPALADLLERGGIGLGAHVGIAGWKYFSRNEFADPEQRFETPSYLVDSIRSLTGSAGSVRNAGAFFMDSTTGMRADCEIDQIAQFEFGAAHASTAIRRMIGALKPGISEFEAVQSMGLIGYPHSCHTMLSTGSRAFGLASPSGKRIERGDPLTSAVGYWGGLSSRAGFVVAGADELPVGAKDYLERLAIPYFRAVVDWYEMIGIGVSGGEMDALVRRQLGDPFFNLILNPGHLIHLDEWMNTPIYPGSTEKLRSGQAIQCDIIPATNSPYFTINIEDGIALLDEAGRAELEERHPDIAGRVAARRAFMGDVLGIRLKPEVLPLSNLAAGLSPFLLAPEMVLAAR